MKSSAQLFHLLLLLLAPLFAEGQETTADKTLSPYFFVKSGDHAVEQLPLLSTSAAVNIAGVIADVTITQVYKNEGTTPIEAVYVFPASTRAAVYGMRMKVGNRTITAQIKERAQAREEYEAARENGQRASLLEQERPNVFQMNVANIQPGDRVEVVLSYTELVVPTGGVYEFVYPTTVGPRYNNGKAANAQFVSQTYTRSSVKPSYDFDINIWLSAGLPLQDVHCQSHKVKVSYEGEQAATVRLDPSEKSGGNRDYILRYSLAGGEIEQGVLLYEHGDENYFLLMVQPPKVVKPKKIPPREYVFIVDVSGSMEGFPLDISKQLMRKLLANLRPEDRFNVMLFAGTSATLANESLPVSPENIARGINFVGQQQGSGGTELLPALQRAMDLPRAEEGVSRSLVVITDGYISFEAEAFDLIRQRLADANLFAFGIGPGVNRHLIEGMAHVGQGEPTIVEQPEGAAEAAERFRQYIEKPVLTRVKVSFDGLDAYDVEPASVPDVLSERPVVVFGKYRGYPKGSITVKGFSGKHRYKASFDVADACLDKRNAALRHLWARERIRLLDDYNHLNESPERVQEVTRLGLKYSLLTAFTSFVAIDREVVKNSKGEAVEQPLPLPEGVSDSAVGFSPAIEGLVLRGVQAGWFSSQMLWRALAVAAGLVLVVVGWRRL